jgi:hypothetical protein
MQTDIFRLYLCGQGKLDRLKTALFPVLRWLGSGYFGATSEPSEANHFTLGLAVPVIGAA